MPYVTVEDEVWVDLDDFDTKDLEEELRKRNRPVGKSSPEHIDRYEAQFLRTLLDEYRTRGGNNAAGVMLWQLDAKLGDMS